MLKTKKIRNSEPTLPPILPNQPRPPPHPVFIQRIRSIDQIEQHIIEKRLKGRDRRPLHHQQGGEGVRAREAEGQDLADQQDDPEILGHEVAEALAFALLASAGWAIHGIVRAGAGGGVVVLDELRRAARWGFAAGAGAGGG